MAWSRFSDCSVYTFPNTSGQLECCGCTLLEPFDSFTTRNVSIFLTHLDHHRQAGDHVPDWLPTLISAEAHEFLVG